MAEHENEHEQEVIRDPITGAETTGHVWDDDLMEFNNPLPKWWLWAFYATFIFSIVYWVIYPSWPVGFLDKGFTAGTSTLTYKKADGEEVTSHWNMRSLYLIEMQSGENEMKRQKMLQEVAATPFDQIASDPQKAEFVQRFGETTFATNCAGCHQKGGQGVIGHYPNLVDDAWLWGGEIADIETSIRNGRNGVMPGHKASLSEAEISDSAHYVLALSGESADAAAAERGKTVFDTKGCAGCHMPSGEGMKALGSANLTDKIWTQANVPGVEDPAGKLAEVKHVIANGIQRQMPPWEGRLSENEIKVLVSYIKMMSAQ